MYFILRSRVQNYKKKNDNINNFLRIQIIYKVYRPIYKNTT